MSDSDDTELLLLIPPDFFLLTEAESEFESRSPIQISQPTYCNCSHSTSISSYEKNYLDGNEIMASHHYHLPMKQQHEIDKINAKISQVERSFSVLDSDISSTTNRTIQSRIPSINKSKTLFPSETRNSNIITSTPKNLPSYSAYERFDDDNGILKEIDKYLEDKQQPRIYNFENHAVKIDPGGDAPISTNFKIQTNIGQNACHGKNKCNRNGLISLNDLWEGKNVENINSTSLSTQLHEEKMRRQHCEKTIQALQQKLLEYQQKISVALQVDKTKDNAINNLQEENECIKNQSQQLEAKIQEVETKFKEEISKLQNELGEIKSSKDCLEKELSQALNLAAKFQDKNDILEAKMDTFTKTNDEARLLYQKQIEELETQLLNAQKSEELANSEIKKLQDLLAKSQNDEEKANKQLAICKKQIDLLQPKMERMEKLEDENKNLNQTVFEISKHEKQLLKEIETQKVALKTHYQCQLEKVVEQKLIEFQSQLDSVEESIKSEARERERTIAERAIKQLELINEKTEQEIRLINEKHSEEVELYRIQLINSSKRIEELEEALNTFRTRRVDMAEKLHSVMETQWQKALEILTSPSTNNEQIHNPINGEAFNRNKLDGLSADSGITKQENDTYTASSSRDKNCKNKHDERLQAYIELLLSKSHRDLNNLDTILNLPKSGSDSHERSSKNVTNIRNSKPPWK